MIARHGLCVMSCSWHWLFYFGELEKKRQVFSNKTHWIYYSRSFFYQSLWVNLQLHLHVRKQTEIAIHKKLTTTKVGSILVLVSVALLRGPLTHVKHMISKERLPFSVSYVGSMVLTLYAALGVSLNRITTGKQNSWSIIASCFDINSFVCSHSSDCFDMVSIELKLDRKWKLTVGI